MSGDVGNAVNSIDPNKDKRWNWCDTCGEPFETGFTYIKKGTTQRIGLCIYCANPRAALARKRDMERRLK